MKKAHLLTIGDEILIGQIVNTNATWMSQKLNEIGLWVSEIKSIGDIDSEIKKAINQSLQDADFVFVTGGLGPTKDDITKKSLAEYFGVEMVWHQPTWERLEEYFLKLGRQLSDGHKAQCFMPSNATILTNKLGTAPGMWFSSNGKILVSMPGVPYEMQYLMEAEVLPKIAELVLDGQTVIHRSICTVGEGETVIADKISKIEDDLRSNLKIAYLPGMGNVRIRVTGTGKDEELLNFDVNKAGDEISEILGDIVYANEDISFEKALQNLFIEKNLTLGLAESCSGGYISHKLSIEPGASKFFMGSIISYDNIIKQNVLGVKSETLNQFGAVSSECVKEMVIGALKVLNVDIAISVSGIAGPDGGTEEKPVGTIWIAVGDKNRILTHKLTFGRDRLRNIQFSGMFALNMARRFVLKLI
jgi:nicotinamide-nucleotide amidase